MISNYIRKCIIILKQKQKQKKIIIERNPGSFVVEVESRIGRVPFDWYHSIVVELNLVVFAWFHVKNPRFPSKEQETSQFVSEETPFSSMVIKLAHQFQQWYPTRAPPRLDALRQPNYSWCYTLITTFFRNISALLFFASARIWVKEFERHTEFISAKDCPFMVVEHLALRISHSFSFLLVATDAKYPSALRSDMISRPGMSLKLENGLPSFCIPLELVSLSDPPPWD